jgi:hypothetical protein
VTPPGRAITDEQKRAVVERLLAAWQRRPELRLGQLLVAGTPGYDVFYVEDADLVRSAERLAGVEEP